VLETPVLETPVLETPVLETPVLETPVLETPVLETPVLETPVLETIYLSLMNNKLPEIVRRFIPESDVPSISPYGSGHINDTFLVTTGQKARNYILQRINHKIFTDVTGLMQNMDRVTSHLRHKLEKMEGHDPLRETLNLVKTIDGQPFYSDSDGNYWRVFEFIPEMTIYENAADNNMAEEAGRIIGLFQRLLIDIEEEIKDTLPGFHSIHLRSGEYATALAADPKQRKDHAKDDILFAKDMMGTMEEYFDSFEIKGFPKRIVHYDTKLNNILFDGNQKAACLIDLDTICPGYVHFDYGDALRTLANTAAEDEPDLGKVKFNQSFYQSFSKGYLSEARAFLSEEEMKLLPFAPIYLTFIIGLRFLTDHLNGDTYFKVKYPDHNLVRARAQFKLVKEMENSIGLRAQSVE
jgi:Ser/Thr protein kinase RdoA (MazF antagonist)